MATAEIITIGTEILLGEIIDTNAPYIARCLTTIGVNLYRKSTIGDNARRIAEAVQEALERADIVITTGGLGPTIDDPTREAVALAAGVETEFREELWEQIQARFRRFDRIPTENNKRQAYIPKGALSVENPVGTAPAFIVEVGSKSILCLPGVPREMEYLLEHAVKPYLLQRYNLTGLIKSRLLHTSGAGESQIDDRIADLEVLSNPTVGLAAHAGQVDIRITARAENVEEADALIAGVEVELRRRLGDWVYGADEDTLEQAALHALSDLGWRLGVVEAGLGGCLTQRLTSLEGVFAGGEVLTTLPEAHELSSKAADFREAQGVECVLGAVLHPEGEKNRLEMVWITPQGVREITRSYGGPPQLAQTWGVNLCLDLLRKQTRDL
jgi:nicotinamide-nucleotide amidase